LRKPAEFGAIVEQARVEEIRRKASCLGLELAKAQYTGIHRKLHEIQRQLIVPATCHHGEFLVQTDQP
jgi:hypothetical protein